MQQQRSLDMPVNALFIDLDGTIYMGNEEVPGASRFVRDMRAAGMRCLFVTNRSNRTPEEIREQLQGYGIECDLADIVTTAQATAKFLAPGRVYVVGEGALVEALSEAGFTICDTDVDYVVVGWDRGFTYEKLRKACSLIGLGAEYVATNPDKGLKMEDGFRPGTGALLAAINTTCDCLPRVIGKPEPHLFNMALQLAGLNADEVIAIGDYLETDIRAASASGMRSALLLTGVSRREDLDHADVKPDFVAEGFSELTEMMLACLGSGVRD
jgi:4-nitrophenyl phosphatase